MGKGVYFIIDFSQSFEMTGHAQRAPTNHQQFSSFRR